MPIMNEYWDETIYFHHTIDQHPRDENFGMHMHYECELLYFISGCATSLIESSEYTLKAGDLILVRPLELHKIQILDSTPYERISMHFSKKLLEEIDPNGLLLEPFFNRPLGQNNLYAETEFGELKPEYLLRRMCVPVDQKTRRIPILVHLYPLLGEIRDAFMQKQSFENVLPENSLVKEIILYINDHLYEPLSLEALSRKFFISVSQLNRIFKQTTFSSVWDYVLNKRLVAARSLIRSGSAVIEASQKCGFRDYSSFYRAYVKKFGISPGRDKASESKNILR